MQICQPWKSKVNRRIATWTSHELNTAQPSDYEMLYSSLNKTLSFKCSPLHSDILTTDFKEDLIILYNTVKNNYSDFREWSYIWCHFFSYFYISPLCNEWLFRVNNDTLKDEKKGKRWDKPRQIWNDMDSGQGKEKESAWVSWKKKRMRVYSILTLCTNREANNQIQVIECSVK